MKQNQWNGSWNQNINVEIVCMQFWLQIQKELSLILYYDVFKPYLSMRYIYAVHDIYLNWCLVLYVT
jgi:hypothetical protein